MTHAPFTDFALNLSSVQLPLTLEKWKNLYENNFNNVKEFDKGIVDIQYSKCQTNKISFDAPIIISGPNSFESAPFASTLCNSNELFYLLMHIGNGHQIGSAAISFVKGSGRFTALGGGRFRSDSNNIILSFEEDELGKFYLLATSRTDLLTIDPLFNFARQFILE